MRIDQIEVGKTYEGRTGKPRTVTNIEWDYSGRKYVDYLRPDGKGGLPYVQAFAKWAVRCIGGAAETPDEEPYKALWQGACAEAEAQAAQVAALREALEKILAITPSMERDGDDDMAEARKIAATGIAAILKVSACTNSSS